MKTKEKQTMSEEQFFQVLSSIETPWVKEGAMIRLLGTRICPICAVANKISGKFTFANNYVAASEFLGLEKLLTQNIADAADRPIQGKVGCVLRYRLLKVCGLTKV